MCLLEGVGGIASEVHVRAQWKNENPVQDKLFNNNDAKGRYLDDAWDCRMREDEQQDRRVICLWREKKFRTYVVVGRGMGSSSRRGSGVEADELAKFRIVVQAPQIGIAGSPVLVAVAGGEGFL